MRLLNKLNNKNFLKITYKLLHDALFVLLIFLAAALLAEGLLPGIVSNHIGMSKPIISIVLLLLLANFISRLIQVDIHTEKIASDKKISLLISVFGTVLILNSMLKINILLNIFITVAVIVAAYLLYQLTAKEN